MILARAVSPDATEEDCHLARALRELRLATREPPFPAFTPVLEHLAMSLEPGGPRPVPP